MRRPAFASRMTGRDTTEVHRASTPLELLFDLTFVVAVSQAAAQLSDALDKQQLAGAVDGYLMVFFAIWWAWVNFTWFASAYDTDDVGYRLLTLVQMSGALVLAAGVPAAFRGDYSAVTVGYVVMRVALVAQWARAAVEDRARRGTAIRYAVGVVCVQCGWVVRLAVPASLGGVSFLALSAAELIVPVMAERRNRIPWHPHHIAERYGLFTLIVLGECVLASTVALQPPGTHLAWSFQRSLLGVGSLILLFLLWWLYFLTPAGVRLEDKPDRAWLWGYGHYAIFAALAALGAGLEGSARLIDDPATGSAVPHAAFAVAIPVSVFLLVCRALHAPTRGTRIRAFSYTAVASATLLAIAYAASLGLAISWCVALSCLPVAALTANTARASDPAALGPTVR